MSRSPWTRGLLWAAAMTLHLAGALAAERPPNILLIVADDLGYSDLGCYGGEIATPNLDALAGSGVRFTQFYNTARCWPSRAAILTGFYAQQVRRDTVPGMPSGTSGTRPRWAPLLPALLRPLGYRSYHSGKWHVDGRPLQNGFDHSYSLNDHDRYFAPKLHTEDDKPLPPVDPNSGYYATTAIAEHAIRCLKEHASEHRDQPFFEFLAFTSPHFPVQAPAADVAKYRDRYVEGWDTLRQGRWSRMQRFGIGGSTLAPIEREVGPPYAFPEDLARLGANEINRPLPWTDLNPAQRRFQADKMAVHAAMVDRMDREIGRVLEQIRSMGAEQDTLVLFLSDNGASAEMMVRGDGHNPDAECGTGATFLSIGPGWSSLANTPFRRHKTWVHEGGISTPLIVSWPRGIAARGELRHAAGHVVDLMPTLLEVAGGKAPTNWAGLEVPPAPGRSLLPALQSDVASVHDSIWWQHEGNRALRRGDWKLVAAGETNAWELYDLRSDRSETHDIAAKHPERVRELASEWTRQTQSNLELARRDPPNPFGAWRHSGSVFINTTPDGANLPAGSEVKDFPILVRLSGEWFPFAEAAADGADLRVSTGVATPLKYQIEEWDPATGVASVWVRVPRIGGNERQELRLHWGNAAARSESSGGAVFNASNGFLGVWHLDGSMQDSTGKMPARDAGTVPVAGTIGRARHFSGGSGIALGEGLTGLPQGSAPHSTEAWFRAEAPNATIVSWGNEHAQGKVVMQFRSPPHVNFDCYFSDANVRSRSPVRLNEWTHVVHTYERGHAKVYVNGVLDGTGNARAAALAIRSPARGWIGGWYDRYDFTGDVDEVRVSSVARSAEWIRLEYENQKPFQTLVGWIVPPAGDVRITPSELTVQEGGHATLIAEVGGVHQVSWSLVEQGVERVVAVDQQRFTFHADRVKGDSTRLLRFRAVRPSGVLTRDIPITIREALPEPAVELKAPRSWDGRTPLTLDARIVNQSALNARGVGTNRFVWTMEGPAVTRAANGGRVTLERAQGSGLLTVRVSVNNGGASTVATATIAVREPRRDAWVARTPGADEQPEDNQFYPRNDRNEGELVCNGIVEGPAEAVFLRVFADGTAYRTIRAPLSRDHRYRISVPLKPGLVRYRTEFGTIAGGVERILKTATNLVCGDAYVIQGQSNAVATDWGAGEPKGGDEWIRTFGSMTGDPEDTKRWGIAVQRGRDTEAYQIGYWGWELAHALVERHRVPVCILNGAVGGTRIDQHQRDPLNPENRATIYGRLLHRVREARLSHGIRGIFWHQGENDQGADGPTGGYGWETYREYFIQLAGSWKCDFPNLGGSYLFQIRPFSCSMGIDGSDNRLREVQRTLPAAFSRWSLMSTVGIEPTGECHYPTAGYSEFARLILPLVERDHYRVPAKGFLTPPNLVRVEFVDSRRDRIRLEFDQPVRAPEGIGTLFQLDGSRAGISSVEVSGSTVVLTLDRPAAKKDSGSRLSYVDGRAWSIARLLRGTNGIAALTFCDVPVGESAR